ncbi:MAG: SDR family NAD(P)-dependent oxidoreductase [Patescibacteria group bacterium]
MNTKELKGKWVLITGGAQRVGAAIAWLLASVGMNVIIHYFTSADAAMELKKKIMKRFKVRVELVSGDLTKPGVIEAIFRQLKKEGTLPYAVLCNAAVFKPDDARENMATNKHAPLRILRIWTKYMLAAGRKGSCIFYGDAWLGRGRRYPKNLAEYSQSKEWIHKGIRRFAQLGHEGIQVVGILNGPIIPPKTVSKKAIAAFARQLCSTVDEKVPWIGPEAVAKATALVLSNRAIHASCIFVDAGRGAIDGRALKEH